MKKRSSLLTGLFLLALAGCGGSQTIVSTMTISASDPGKTLSLIQATERVMVRRLAAANVKGATATAVPTGTASATLTLTLPDSAAAEKAKNILSEPFTFDMRTEVPKTNPGPDEAPSDWIATALTGSNLQWVQVIGNSVTGEVSIELQLTKQGRTILESIFRDHRGQHLGIFVRDLLVSKLKIESTPVSDNVLISGIPSAKVAEIFADDVNVGLKVSFTPAP